MLLAHESWRVEEHLNKRPSLPNDTTAKEERARNKEEKGFYIRGEFSFLSCLDKNFITGQLGPIRINGLPSSLD